MEKNLHTSFSTGRCNQRSEDPQYRPPVSSSFSWFDSPSEFPRHSAPSDRKTNDKDLHPPNYKYTSAFPNHENLTAGGFISRRCPRSAPSTYRTTLREINRSSPAHAGKKTDPLRTEYLNHRRISCQHSLSPIIS